MVIDVDLLCGEKWRMLDVMKVGKKLGLIMMGAAFGDGSEQM